MLKIRALNRDSLSDEDAPSIRKEAQEEIALNKYNQALRLKSNGKLDESAALLLQLLQHNIPQLESQGGLPKTMSTLKYSCLINVGNIARDKNNHKEAFDSFTSASKLDCSDVTLWYRLGTVALKLERYKHAIHAFLQGLECNDSHWPCLDYVVLLLYATKDTIGCLMYITKALLLNPNYAQGLVLRKLIYNSNPAAREYYKIYNPDYISEPNLDTPIAKEDEEACFERVKNISDRINEIEKSMAPKLLNVVTLPTVLEDYTWLSAGKAIANVHKYISEKRLSHFCKVDLTNSTSQVGVSTNKLQPLVEDTQTDNEVIGEPAMETDSQINIKDVERQVSVVSDHNYDANDVENMNSSQAEDNDEMDQDTEDQEENLEQKCDKKQGTKRRRNLLLDLQVWGWHSKRKSAKKTKSEKDLCVEDALKRLIPSHLLPKGLKLEKYNLEDSMNTSDIRNLFTEQQPTVSCLSPISSPNTNDYKNHYFGSQKEKNDVAKFWVQNWECCDAVSLVEQVVHILASFWNLKWPKKLISVYIELYNMYREHFEHPLIFSSGVTFDEIKNDALATLIYGEFVLYKSYFGDAVSEGEIHPTSLAFLQMISGWEKQWKEEYVSFFVRVHWLNAHVARKSFENALAIRSLELVKEVIKIEQCKNELKFRLYFPNYKAYPVVSLKVLEKLLRHLQMIDSLSRLEQLYNSKQYNEVIEILESTFSCVGTPPTCGKIGRPAQLGMLMDSLWYTDKTKCFVWTEKCLAEAVAHHLKPFEEREKWLLVLNKCVLILYEIIKEETVAIVDELTQEAICSLIKNLCLIVCRQLNIEGQPTQLHVLPWILLYYVLLRDEHREQASKTVEHVWKKRKLQDKIVENEESQEKELPASIAILFSAHEFLGPKSWCLSSGGELLHFIIDNILDRLDTPIFECLRDKIDIHLEQAFFCLYQHPSKKNKISRHLADHNVNPLPLSWERAQQLYEFFCPDNLPEFDSFKAVSISSDLEQLLQRITALVPSQCDLQSLVPLISDFVNGNSTKLPEPVQFPNKIRALYYLLGDYYFKQGEISKSVKYFLLDLSINPQRSDTWANLALGYASQLENKLTHCERFKSENEFLDKAKSSRICFRQALQIIDDPITLWIEFGSFEYMVHSYCSRMLKYESDTFNMEKFGFLENEKESYLNSCGDSFSKALDLYQSERTDPDERWLHHYMLGKVAEKKRKEPTDYLQHYLTAAALLQENSATYPNKIQYHNPQHLSVEALEIHYRIHASILKFLELHEGESIPSSLGKVFKKCLDTSKHYKAMDIKSDKVKTKETTAGPPSPAPPKDDYSEIVECVDNMLQKVELDALSTTTIKTKNAQDIMDELMRETMSKEQQHAIDSDSDSTNVEDVVKLACSEPKAKSEQNPPNIRKSIEETTTSLSSSSDSSSSDSEDSDDSSSSSSNSSSDSAVAFLQNTEVNTLVDRCISGLEECITRLPQNYKALYRLVHLYLNYKPKKDISKCRQLLLGEYKCASGSTVQGLFAEHKANNFFNGVWRIPSSEIDRAGSLAAHMNRCVTLLLQVLRETNDHKVLLDVCLQLRRTPDADKIYIRNSEREQLSEQALSMCIHSLRSQLKNAINSGSLQKYLLDVFRAYQRVQKSLSHKESTFSSMVVEAYKKLMQDKIPENVNILDSAIKYCQQHKATEKLKIISKQVTTTVSSPAIVMGSTPVLPTPSNFVRTNLTLKRPTLGRPRGRPPGPKQTSLNRLPRGRSPIQNAGWQNMMYDQNALNYMIKYQEELLRQYKTLSEMNRLAYGDQITNQFCQSRNTQMPFVGSSPLQQAFSQMATAGMNPSTLNQIAQNANSLSPNLIQQLIEQCSSQAGGSKTMESKKTVAPKTASISKSPPKAVHPTYTTAGFSKNVHPNSMTYLTSQASSKTTETITLNLPSAEIIDSSKKLPLQQPTNARFGERPNISITPVMQITQAKPTTTFSPSQPVKTLQEKLADKQKQHMIEKNKVLSNLPSFSVDSGISISQISGPNVVRTQEADGFSHKPAIVKTKQLPSITKSPTMSVSVIKKTSDVETKKPLLDDDVIIIE